MSATMDGESRGGYTLLRCLLFLRDDNNYYYCQLSRVDIATKREIRPVSGGNKFH